MRFWIIGAGALALAAAAPSAARTPEQVADAALRAARKAPPPPVPARPRR